MADELFDPRQGDGYDEPVNSQGEPLDVREDEEIAAIVQQRDETDTGERITLEELQEEFDDDYDPSADHDPPLNEMGC